MIPTPCNHLPERASSCGFFFFLVSDCPRNSNAFFYLFFPFSFFSFLFSFFLKAPKHTLPPQTPTRTALAHSTRTKSTDPVYGSVSLSATGDRCNYYTKSVSVSVLSVCVHIVSHYYYYVSSIAGEETLTRGFAKARQINQYYKREGVTLTLRVKG